MYQKLQWILNPLEVFEKIISATQVPLKKPDLDWIETRYQQRSEWIIPYVKKQQEELKKRQAEELKYKIEFLNAKLNENDNSDESEEEQQQQTGEVSDKADALYQAQQILPLSNTKINEFMKAITEINGN